MQKFSGFTLIELMVTVAILAIIAAIAYPAYTHFIISTNAESATNDLTSLSLSYESIYQMQLQYPAYSSGTTATTSLFSGWSPATTDYFDYKVSSTTTDYTLTATGKNLLNGCVLTLNKANTRTATQACGFTSW